MMRSDDDSFVRMTISSEVAVHQISFEHRVVNIG